MKRLLLIVLTLLFVFAGIAQARFIEQFDDTLLSDGWRAFYFDSLAYTIDSGWITITDGLSSDDPFYSSMIRDIDEYDDFNLAVKVNWSNPDSSYQLFYVKLLDITHLIDFMYRDFESPQIPCAIYSSDKIQ